MSTVITNSAILFSRLNFDLEDVVKWYFLKSLNDFAKKFIRKLHDY